MASYSANPQNTTKWPSVTRARLCPKCGKPNRCRLAPDGKAGICWREGDRKVWHDPTVGSGQHHQPVDPRPAPAQRTYISADEALAACAPPGGKLVKVWQYPRDVMRVGRFDLDDGSKQFRPIHHLPNGWAVGDPPGPLPLYRGDELPSAGTIYVTEGEKCADIMRDIGLPAVASAHGALSAKKSDWTPLARRDVVIPPDNDEAGEQYAADVTEILNGMGASVRVLKLPGLPAGGDVEQFDQNIGGEPEATRAEIEKLVAAIPAPTPLIEAVADVMASCPELRPVVIDGLLRESEVGNIVSQSKIGKTWLAMDLALAVATGRMWLGQFEVTPGRVLYIDAELHRQTFARRLAEVAKARGILTDEFTGKLDLMSLRGRLRDLFELDAVFRQIERGKYRLIIIDALYRLFPADLEENSNAGVTALYNRLDQYGEMTGAGIMCVHHSSKGSQAQKTITDVGSGAGAQARAVDLHLIIRAHEEPDAAVMEAAVRSFPPLKPIGLRWQYPTWTIDKNLDTSALREAPGKRKSKESPEASTVSVDEFIRGAITSTPKPKAIILTRAMQNCSGLTDRKARTLLEIAEDEGRIFRHPGRDAREVRYSTVKPALFDDSGGENNIYRAPPTPPGDAKRHAGRGIARARKTSKTPDGKAA
jgi:AAA domain